MTWMVRVLPSESLCKAQKWEEWLIDQRVVLKTNGTWTVWRNRFTTSFTWGKAEELGLFSLDELRFGVNLISAYKNLKRWCEDNKVRLFTVVPVTEYAMDTNRNTEDFLETLSYCEGNQALKQVVQGETPFWEIFKTHWNMGLGDRL